MNFQPELARAVLDGRKTVTRRLASSNPRSPWSRERCGLRAGDSFAVCPGRGKPAVGRARVLAVARVSLGRLDEREAAREGFGSAKEFERAFTIINGGYDPDAIVWRIEFELLARDGQQTAPAWDEVPGRRDVSRGSPADDLDATRRLTRACESAELAATASPTASPTGVGSPSERKPAGSRAGRRVVRPSEPPAEPHATDPSSEIGSASTGDTSLLEHEQPGVRKLVLGALSGSDKRLVLEGGTPRHELSSSSGPLRPEVTLRRREILVSQYTSAAWRSHLAWHGYWDQHGGFGGANLDDEQLMAGSPPSPRSDHSTVRLTWGQARKWVREEAAEQASAAAKASSDMSRAAAAGGSRRRVGVPARTRHDLDRAGQQLRDRFAYRPSGRGPGDPRWAWTDAAAQGCEASIREVLADAARASIDTGAVQRRSRAVLEVAHELLTGGDTSLPPASATHATRRPDMLAAGGCAWCSGPMPDGLRPEARFCKKRCRQAASRARLKAQPARSPSPPPETCAWCSGPMPDGLRPEARFCKKRCRQASSRFGLAVKRTAPTPASGPDDVSRLSPTPADTTRRRRPPRREVLDDASRRDRAARPMRFAYADPPYPGRAHYYPEQAEVDHQALVERLVADFPDGWALSTSAEALQHVLTLCPAGVRVGAWQRAVRPTRSRRPISAWEPLIVHGGRELPLDEPQAVRNALAYGGRFRAVGIERRWTLGRETWTMGRSVAAHA